MRSAPEEEEPLYASPALKVHSKVPLGAEDDEVPVCWRFWRNITQSLAAFEVFWFCAVAIELNAKVAISKKVNADTYTVVVLWILTRFHHNKRSFVCNKRVFVKNY